MCGRPLSAGCWTCSTLAEQGMACQAFMGAAGSEGETSSAQLVASAVWVHTPLGGFNPPTCCTIGTPTVAVAVPQLPAPLRAPS